MTVRQRLGELEFAFTRAEFARYLVVTLTLFVVQAFAYRPIINVLIETTPHGPHVWEPLMSVYAFLFAVAVGLWSVIENEHA